MILFARILIQVSLGNFGNFLLQSLAIFPVVDVMKLFLEEIKIYPKLRNWKKLDLMCKPELKRENNAILSETILQNCFLRLQ